MTNLEDGRWVRREIDKALESTGMPLLERLVNQNSFSSNVAGVARVQDMLAELLADLDLTVELERSPESGTPGRGPILAARTRAHSTARHGIALVFHADTVHPPDSPFCGLRVEGERAIGPGVFDMKAGIVSAYLAARFLRENGLLSEMPLLFAVNSAEEDGSPEANRVMSEIVSGSRAALVFEFGRAGDEGCEGLVTMRNGMAYYKAELRGKASHVREYDKGANAIEEVARLVLALADLRDPDAGITVNQGRVSGGRSLNVVPDRATLEWEIRAPTTAFFDEVAALRETEWSSARDPRVSVEISRESFSPPLEESPASLGMYRRYLAAGAKAGVRFSKRPREFGLSDGNLIGRLPADRPAACVPVLDGLGPMGGGAHTDDEWVSVPSIAERAHALVEFLRGWSREGWVF